MLGINTLRMDIRETYACALDSELEIVLVDSFYNRILAILDIILPQNVFQKIISELAPYDEI